MPINIGISGIRLKSQPVGTRIRLDGRVSWLRRCWRVCSAFLPFADWAPMDSACGVDTDKADPASVYLPWAHVSISISEAFVFTAVLLYGHKSRNANCRPRRTRPIAMGRETKTRNRKSSIQLLGPCCISLVLGTTVLLDLRNFTAR